MYSMLGSECEKRLDNIREKGGFPKLLNTVRWGLSQHESEHCAACVTGKRSDCHGKNLLRYEA
jgi:hypothetical protein